MDRSCLTPTCPRTPKPKSRRCDTCRARKWRTGDYTIPPDLPFDQLATWVNHVAGHQLTPTELAERLGTTNKQIWRWTHTNRISHHTADQIATHLFATHPANIWGDTYYGDFLHQPDTAESTAA